MSVTEEEPFKSYRKKLKKFADSLGSPKDEKFRKALDPFLNQCVVTAGASRQYKDHIDAFGSQNGRFAAEALTEDNSLYYNSFEANLLGTLNHENTNYESSINGMLKFLSNNARNFVPRHKRPEPAGLLKELAGIMADEYGVTVDQKFYPAINKYLKETRGLG